MTEEHFFLFSDKQLKMQTKLRLLEWLGSWRSNLLNMQSESSKICLFSSFSSFDVEDVRLESKTQRVQCLQGKFWLKGNTVVPCACEQAKNVIPRFFEKLVLDIDWNKELRKSRGLVKKANQENSPNEKLVKADASMFESFLESLPKAVKVENSLQNWQGVCSVEVQKKYQELNKVSSLFYSQRHAVILQDWIFDKTTFAKLEALIGWKKEIYFFETEKNQLVSTEESTIAQSFGEFLELLEKLNCTLRLFSARTMFGGKKYDRIVTSEAGDRKVLFRDKTGKLRTSLKSFSTESGDLSWQTILPAKQFDLLLGLQSKKYTLNSRI